jgi:hypothetical protein
LVQLLANSTLTGCNAEKAAFAALNAGANGVIVAAALSTDVLHPIGTESGAGAGLTYPATMVSSDSGAQLQQLLAAAGPNGNISLNYASNGGAGELIAVDARGKFQEVGWQKYADARMLSWAGDYLEHAHRRDVQLRAPALVVPVFDQDLTTTVATVTLPIQTLVDQFPSVELDLALECPYGNRDKDCLVWDRVVNVQASCTMPIPIDAQGGGQGKGGQVKQFELGRWINAFQRRVGRWVTRTPVLSGLGGATCNFTATVDLANTWRFTLNIRYCLLKSCDSSAGAGAGADADASSMPLPSSLSSSWSTEMIIYPNPTEQFGGPSYNVNRTITFTPPAGTTHVVIAALITGHGGCEFQATSHHWIVNKKNDSYHNTSNEQ